MSELTPAQLKQLRQISTRLLNAGVLEGSWSSSAQLKAELFRHGLEVEPGPGPVVFARHELGRVLRFLPQGSTFRFEMDFDPVGGLRVARALDVAPRDLFQAVDRKVADASMWWDGRRILSGRFLGFDTEATLIVPGEYPQLVLASASSAEGDATLLEPQQIPDFFELHLAKRPDAVWCGWNLAEFDWPALDYRLPGFRSKFHARFVDLARRGRWFDTMLVARLWDIAAYGQLFKPGGKLTVPSWGGGTRGYYALAAQTKRWLDLDLPKGEGLLFGEYLGRVREITADMAAYALADPMVTAAIQHAIWRHPFTHEVAKKARREMERLSGRLFSFLKPDPPAVSKLMDGPIDFDHDPAPDSIEPMTLASGLKFGWQTHTVQLLGGYGASRTSRNGMMVDVDHVRRFLGELELDRNARLEQLGGQAGSRIVEVAKGCALERLALPAGVPAEAWLPRVESRIRDWERKPKDRNNPLELKVVPIPARRFLRPLPGIIRTPRHFPTLRMLSAIKHKTFLIEANVTDSYDPAQELARFKLREKAWSPLGDAGTHTGQSFKAGQVIRWGGQAWLTVEGAEAEAERQRILSAAASYGFMLPPVKDVSGVAEDEEETNEDDADTAQPKEAHTPFQGDAYPFISAIGTNATAIDAYIRENLFPLPPDHQLDPSLPPTEQLPIDSALYEELAERVGRRRDQWLMIFGAKDVDYISDPVLREYFMLKRSEKELGAVRSYVPGVANDRQAVHGLNVEQTIDKLGLRPFRRARVFPELNALGAATGRTAQNKPNLTQVSTDPRHRGSFVPSRRRKLVVTDVGSTEMATQAEIYKRRYASLLPGRRLLADYLNEGYDTHYLIAMEFRFPTPEQKAVWMPILGDLRIRAMKLAVTEDEKVLALGPLLTAFPGKKINPKDSGEDIAKDLWEELLAEQVVKHGWPMGDETDARTLIKRARAGAKPANFGLAGGMQAGRLMSVSEIDYGIRVTRDQAGALIYSWKTMLPDGAMWLLDGRQFLIRKAPLPAPVHGYYDMCFVLTGRLRGQLAAAEELPEWKRKRMPVDELYDEGLNEWHNTQFQGLASDGAKLGMYAAVDEGLCTSNFVHDELDEDEPEALVVPHLQLAQNALLWGMEQVVRLVRLTIGGKFMSRWKK